MSDKDSTEDVTPGEVIGFCITCDGVIYNDTIVEHEDHEIVDTADAIAPAPSAGDEDAALLRAELEQLRAELETEKGLRVRAEQEVSRHSPFVDVPVFTTPEEVMEFYGPDLMRLKAEANLETENRKRVARGAPPLYAMAEEEYQRYIGKMAEQIAVKMADAADRWIPDSWEDRVKMRTLKMLFPVRSPRNRREWSYSMADGASFRQVPLEAQLNNAAGSIADGVLKYQNKRAKVGQPIRCLLYDCWMPAAVTESGSFRYVGYCCEDHMTFVEGEKATSGKAGSRGDSLLMHTAGFSTRLES